MDGQFDPLALDNADDFIAKALSLFARGVADRRAAFHTISLATIGLDGTPQLRTVVLRGFDSGTRAITFHTDKRAAKFAELLRTPSASALAYDPGAKLQIRINGAVKLHNGDDHTTKIWSRLQPTSRACYHTPDTPGTTPSGTEPLAEREARANFCVCTLNIAELDILYLRAGGHLRARTNFTQGGQAATWVAA